MWILPYIKKMLVQFVIYRSLHKQKYMHKLNNNYYKLVDTIIISVPRFAKENIGDIF